MKRTNVFVLCKERYHSDEEFEKALLNVVKMLIENEYIITVRYNEPDLGIVVIEYNDAERVIGAPYPYWLTAEEVESVSWED